jgi:hypothetical protein
MLLNAPSSAFGTFSPQETAGGEGLSIERGARAFGVKCAGVLDEKEWPVVSM